MKFFLSCLITIFFCVIHSSAQVNLNNGLVASLPFNGNALDVSGNNNNGIPQNGIQLTTDRFGIANSAYLYDGIDDHIVISDPQGKFSTTPFSSVLWFQTQSTQFQVMIGKRDFGSQNGQQYQVSIFRPFAGLFSSVTSNAIPCSGNLSNNVLSMTNDLTTFCQERWHCVIVTFDGLIHKMYLDGNLVSQNIPNFAQMLSCNSDIRLGNWWSLDPLWFKGKLDDFRWYNRILTNDEIQVLSDGSNLSEGSDFTYDRNVCSTNTLRFNNISVDNQNITWSFGDGTSSSGVNNPVHTYQGYTSYLVTMITGNTPVCRDTVQKLINLDVRQSNLILTSADTAICEGDSVRFRTVPSDNFCWQPDPTLLESWRLDAYAKPLRNTVYSITQEEKKANLVVNGNFNDGNTGFTSDYNFVAQRNADGQYGIAGGAKQWMPVLPCTNCSDHTAPGTGLMLISDGSITSGKNIWCQKINVQPNSEYKISFWTNTYSGPSLSRPELLINNRTALTVTTSVDTDAWKQNTVYWNSGKNTSMEICLRNDNTISSGNLFAIDDIEVAEAGFIFDYVTVRISGGNVVASNDTSICKNQGVQLNVTGGGSYIWTPSTGLSDPSIANPVARPTSTTRYVVRSAVNGACAGKDSVLVTIQPLPVVVTIKEAVTCEGIPVQISASGGVKYNWSPAESLSDPNLPNPVAVPVVTTNYSVLVTDNNGCSETGAVKVSISPKGKLFIPNAFTPNGDGINDCFNIKGAEGASYYELSIYNRFGERVFFADKPSQCWNGFFKGIPQPSGSFAYTLKINGSCGNIVEKGTLSIIR